MLRTGDANRPTVRHPLNRPPNWGNFNASKRLKGRQRHVAVDRDGLLLGILVHAADIQDADGLGQLLKRLKPLYLWLRTAFADSIYNRLAAWLACSPAGLALIIVRRLAGTTGVVGQPRRWVVERSFGWFGRWRRLSKDYKALPGVLRGNGHPGRNPPHAAPPGPSQPRATAAHTFKTGSQRLAECIAAPGPRLICAVRASPRPGHGAPSLGAGELDLSGVCLEVNVTTAYIATIINTNANSHVRKNQLKSKSLRSFTTCIPPDPGRDSR